MKKSILAICLAAFLCWPVSVMAGCGSWPENTSYLWLEPNQSGTVWVYSGITSVPSNVPAELNQVTIIIANAPAWAKARNTGEQLTLVQRAAECNLPIDRIMIMQPPDCNKVPVTTLGDPNLLYWYRLAIDCNKPPVGKFSFQVRMMDAQGTSEIDKTIVVNRPTKKFWWNCFW